MYFSVYFITWSFRKYNLVLISLYGDEDNSTSLRSGNDVNLDHELARV